MDVRTEPDTKTPARKTALARRKAVKSPDRDALAITHLLDVMLKFKGRPVAGYIPVRSEVDPLPVMAALEAYGPVCVPVIDKAHAPLKFRAWTPFVQMTDGEFGIAVPADGAWIVPEVVIVPLVAFTREGARLGYGGGFYDRTLEKLRREGDITAIGYAFDAQQTDALPIEPTDQILDMIVTESGVIAP